MDTILYLLLFYLVNDLVYLPNPTVSWSTSFSLPHGWASFPNKRGLFDSRTTISIMWVLSKINYQTTKSVVSSIFACNDIISEQSFVKVFC